MATDRSRISTDIDFEQEGFRTGTLRVPHSVDRSAYGHIPIPIAVLKRGDGPTALLTGGNHGDEYEGPIALMKLLQRMPSMQISGRLIVVPGLNFPAFLAGRRTSPIDGANMNRIFPGRRDGSITEMIAHYVDTELFPRADFVFDIHAGGASFDHLPTLLVAPPADAEQRREYKRIVDAFAAPNAMVMDLLGEDRTYGAAIERHGKLFLCGEFGGYATLQSARPGDRGGRSCSACLRHSASAPANRCRRRVTTHDGCTLTASGITSLRPRAGSSSRYSNSATA